MKTKPETAPDNPDTVAALKRQLNKLQAEMAAKEARWEQERRSIYEQIRLLLDNRFGPSTEKYQVDQRDLFFNEPEALLDEADETDDEAPGSEAEAVAATPARKRRTRGGRVALPPELPRVEVIHELPEEEHQCPHDGAPLTVIGETVSEQLEIVPARIQVIRHVRRKYGCRSCEEGVTTAALPAQLLPKSNAGPGLLAYIAVAKYVDALPLYRQEQAFKRLGVELPRNTLARWMIQLGDRLSPLIERLRQHLLAQPLLHMDETTLQVNQEKDRAASSTSYMWVQRGGPPGQQAVLFDYAASRAGKIPSQLLEDYRGILVTDGYEGYAQVVRTNGLVHAGCWAHARRKFMEAKKVQPKGKVGRADKALSLISQLYKVEQQGKHLSATQRLALRAEHSQPLMDKLEVWLEKTLAQVPPKTAIGRAVQYLHSQWPRLTQFLENGLIPLDNNPAENAIRPFVVGRKNWLFCQTTSGADASARLYSLIETAKANGIEPYNYLSEIFQQLPTAASDEALDALLPWRWKETLPV